MMHRILASVFAVPPFGCAAEQPIRLINVRDHLATVEVVTSGQDPAVGSLSSALSPAGIQVVFCETQFARRAFRERIIITNEDGHAFTTTRIRQVLDLATGALRGQLARAAEQATTRSTHVRARVTASAAQTA
jgi:hypothetical protein